MKGNSHKFINIFSRNSAGQKGMAGYILNDERGGNLHPRLLYPASISFTFNREIRSFRERQNLTEFSTTKPVLQQMLKELL